MVMAVRIGNLKVANHLNQNQLNYNNVALTTLEKVAE